jgi:hypothetical protein
MILLEALPLIPHGIIYFIRLILILISHHRRKGMRDDSVPRNIVA